MARVSGVYTITNTVNNRRYAGSSADVRQRWRGHRSELRRGLHRITQFQQDWDEHGEKAFKFEMIVQESDAAKRLAIEQALITADDLEGRGYNLFNTGPNQQILSPDNGIRGKAKSDEHRANIWKNREKTPEFLERMRANGQMGRGKPKSAEHRAKIGAKQVGSGNHAAKLTEDQVREIKRRLALGEKGYVLAAEFGVGGSVISNIKNGRVWRHVT
jgi:group I intron endonuclease